LNLFVVQRASTCMGVTRVSQTLYDLTNDAQHFSRPAIHDVSTHCLFQCMISLYNNPPFVSDTLSNGITYWCWWLSTDSRPL